MLNTGKKFKLNNLYSKMKTNTLAYIFRNSIILPILFLNACSTLQTAYDYDKKADFRSYKSFSFHEKGLEKLEMNDLDKRRIIESVTKNLEEKGLKRSEGQADLYVNILSFTKEKVNIYNNNWPYWQGWYGPWWSGGWGMQQVRKYTEGSILIDLVESKTNTLVWEGKGSDLNLDELEGKDERIQAVVKAILAHYPPYKKTN